MLHEVPQKVLPDSRIRIRICLAHRRKKRYTVALRLKLKAQPSCVLIYLLHGKLARNDLLHKASSRELLVLLRIPLELRLVVSLLLLELDLLLDLAQDLHEVCLSYRLEQILLYSDLDRLSGVLEIIVPRDNDYLGIGKLLKNELRQ